MTDATKTAPAPKPGILDIAPYVGGKGAIAGFAEPMKLSSNENALGAGQKAREAYAAALKNIHVYPDGRATKLREAVTDANAVGDLAALATRLEALDSTVAETVLPQYA